MQIMIKLSRLKKVELRKAWAHEALDFTNWLALSENLELLSEEIGLDISLIQTEASVGKFNVDILAEQEASGRKIIIENQLEMTDHDHLGKIITYASGYDAEIVIWIVKDVREEHKQAIDWLNEHTDNQINFFAIKMELWKIEDSAIAPKFQIVSQPNGWAKALKTNNRSQNLTDTKALQFDFWSSFKEFATEKGTKFRLQKPQPQHWYVVSLGVSEAHISLTINSRTNELGCEVYIADSKELFEGLLNNKDQIEAELGEELEWLALEGKKASRIKLVHQADISKIDDWENYFVWLIAKVESFQKVFGKIVKKVR